MSSSADRYLRRCLAIIMISVMAWTFVFSLLSGNVYADYPKLPNRKLVMGTAEPGAMTDYTFSWSYPAPTNVRSVRMQLCDDPYVELTCSSTPPGDFSGAVLTSQTGPVAGFSILSTAVDEIILTRATSAAPVGASTYAFDNIVNPTGLAKKFYIRLYTYPTADASGPANHMSSIVQATTTPILITTIVPPILYFCVGLTVSEWCTNATGNSLDYGDLLDASDNYGTSQFGVATNAIGGYAVTVNGNTMAAGNKIIDALSVPDTRQPGVGQFGLNLRANTDPAVGADISGLGLGTVAADYDIPDMFKFVDGDTVATAVTGTMFDTFTVTYIVNVPPDQPSGIYNTTITYICTAAF